MQIGDTAPDGGQLRPHVVFFGESIYNYDAARSICKRADIMIVVGTSLAVYPAAYLVEKTSAHAIYIVDPNVPPIGRLSPDARRVQRIRKTATEGVLEIINKIVT